MRVRAAERQADYTGVYLAAWAGYDPHAAASFWRHISRAGPFGPPSDGSHPGDGTRIRDLARAAAEIDAKRARGAPLEPDYAAFAAGGRR